MSPSIFDLGTVTLTNGSAEVTGDGTAWAVNGVVGGMFSAGGVSVPIASVDDDTTLTLAYDWPGSTVTGETYAISLLGAQAAETIWASRHWSRIVGQALLAGIVPVASGTLAERDALDPQPALGEWFAHAEPPYDLTFYRKVPEGWEGPYQFRGAASTVPGPAGDGFNPAGAWEVGTTYAKNDMVSFGPRSFVSFADGNTGNEPPDADEDDAHWQFVPAAVGPKGDTGDAGPQGEKGDTGDTGPAGPANVLTIGTVNSGETADASITGSSPSQVLNLVLPKGDKGDQGDEGPQGPPGQDGTGTGDVVGPSSATDGHMVVFDGTTGKLIKSAGEAPFSGDYGDLDNKPTLGSAAAQDTSAFATAAQGALADGAIPASLLTTRGDIIYRGASAPQRLAKGTAGQVLTMGADDPAWAAPSGGGAPSAVLEDQKSSGTGPGSVVTNTWTTRVLNTEVRDPDSIVSLSSNQFTVTVDCWCRAMAPFMNTSITRLRIWNVTDSALVALGQTGVWGGGNNNMMFCEVQGALVAGKTYRIDYNAGAAGVIGGASSLGTEIYTQVYLWRL